MEKQKNRLIVGLFALLLAGIMLLQIFSPDHELSVAERRKLMQMPQLSVETVFSGEYMEDLEKYLLDQFPLREQMRRLNAFVRLDLFQQKDNNDIYLVEDSIFKIEYPLDEEQVLSGAQKFNQIYEQYLTGMPVYYSIIPDKNYFVAEQNGYPSLDYDRLQQVMQENVRQEIQYINIFDCLKIEDYYRTDAHWRQECLEPVATRLTEQMGTIPPPPLEFYTKHQLSPFYGVYLGQAAMPVPPDELIYLTNATTEQAQVDSLEHGAQAVYAKDKFADMDGYNLFLSGPEALQTITNPQAATKRELIIFRDSFSSSLTPLLLDSYAKITLIDLRYITPAILGDYVDFKEQDVLFLYSTVLLNSSRILK